MSAKQNLLVSKIADRRTTRKGEGSPPAQGWSEPGRAANLHAVDRFFSLFPSAARSSGLILLRIAVAMVPHLDAAGHFVVARPDWQVVVSWVCSAALIAGFLTPLFAGVVAVVALTQLGGANDSLGPAVRVVISVSLALLGPGPYSLDARLFGPRTVVMTMHRDPDSRNGA